MYPQRVKNTVLILKNRDEPCENSLAQDGIYRFITTRRIQKKSFCDINPTIYVNFHIATK